MNYTRALAERRRALTASRAARGNLRNATNDVVGVYQAHPVSALAGAAGIGFVLAQLQVGSGLVRAGLRIATGPAWRLAWRFLNARP